MDKMKGVENIMNSFETEIEQNQLSEGMYRTPVKYNQRVQILDVASQRFYCVKDLNDLQCDRLKDVDPKFIQKSVVYGLTFAACPGEDTHFIFRTSILKNSGANVDVIQEDHTIYLETASKTQKNFPVNLNGSMVIASKGDPRNLQMNILKEYRELAHEPMLKDQKYIYIVSSQKKMYLRAPAFFETRKYGKKRVRGIYYDEPILEGYTNQKELGCEGIWEVEFTDLKDKNSFRLKHVFANKYLGLQDG